jgi:transcriptional regulator with XRE-family HTH domain
MDVTKTFEYKLAEILRRARLKKGMNQIQIAEAVGASDPEISRYENGRVVPEFGRMLQLCKVLDIDINDIVKAFESSQAKRRPPK